MLAQQQIQDETSSETSKVQKKRRMRACDLCRQRKVRCDGDSMPENRCSNCRTFECECTYVEGSSKRYGNASYVQGLETELASLRAFVRKMHPDTEDPRTTSGFLATLGTGGSTMTGVIMRPPGATWIVAGGEDDDVESSDDEIAAHRSLAERFKKISLRPEYDHDHSHFFGKSSSFMLVKTAMEMKHEYASGKVFESPRRDDFSHRRPEFWAPYPWMLETANRRDAQYSFPEAGLMTELVHIYFTTMNIYIPLLHEPTFVQNIEKGLHLTNEAFGATLLLVCALGSRQSDDPRVLLEGTDTWHSAGWSWFRQVLTTRNAFILAPPQIYDLQIACLAAMYMGSSSAPGSAWTLVGTGLRMAQDMGAHRRKMYSGPPTVEGELRKRAFWVLIAMDRMMCSMLGRPCSIQDEDFDVDLPIECDDEYWAHPDPSKAFTQPPGKPSLITYFNCTLRLDRLNAFALRTIYSINKSKPSRGLGGPEWEQQIVSEIDSELNKWIDSVPEHLRWNPHREESVFMSQSAVLYSAYYSLQIMIHRPFIPSPRKPAPLSFPSLAICTNAARSSIHVLDTYYNRAGVPYYPWHHALFIAGVVLLFNIWGAKRAGSVTNSVKEMGEVHTAMKVLKALEPRWHSAGRLWDLLYDLANIGDLPLPQLAKAGQKRSRYHDNDTPNPSSPALMDPNEPRKTAGMKRVQQYQQAFPCIYSESPGADTPLSGNGLLNLPTHSGELGRLPLHRIFGSSSSLSDLSDHLWSPPGSVLHPSVTSATPDLDHSLESIFSDAISPEVYDQLLGTLRGLEPSDVQQLLNPQTYVPASSTSNVGLNHATAPLQTPVDDAGQIFSHFPDKDTLDIWSNAPNSFEWDDWGTYITNLTK